MGVGVIAGLLVAALALPAVGGLGITARNVASGFLDMPGNLETPPPPQRSTIYDSEGGVIAEIFDQNRELVELDDVAPVMIDAILAIEDAHFYEHGGLDIAGTLRAAIRTVGGDTQGASSITQQYVKNVQIEAATSQEELDAAREETIARKIRELRYAVALEKRMTKDEILEGYLNIAYFSDGAYGVESAAQHFFQVPASDLELHQAATIAGLVRYPYLYNPRFFPEQTIERRDVVLDRMVATGAITKAEAAEAKKEPMELDLSTPPNGCVPSDQPFFCDYVVQEIEQDERFGPNETERARWLRTAGLEIHTTLDPQTQKAAQKAVDKWVPRENESRKVAAEVVIEPGTGQILGMVQSRNYGPDESKLGETSINFATDADRGGSSGFQAGSTFKAITLAAALDKGLPFGTSFGSPSSVTVSGQRSCNGGMLSTWSVSNAGDTGASTTHNMVSGTKSSSNTFFAQLQKRVGICDVMEMAETLGLKRADGTLFTENDNSLANSSFTLGSEEVSPLRVANAYATFASGGVYCEPQAITRIKDQQSDTTIEIEPECSRAIDEDVADGVTYLLTQPFNGGTASSLGIGRPAAGKTGTTDESAAAWFAGYTPQMASAVFVGDPRGPQQHPLRNINLGGRYYGVVYGATIPGPIWQETMRGAHEGLKVEQLPSAPSKFGSTAPPAPPSPDPDEEDASPASDEGGVPDVVGLSEEDAVSILEAAGYAVNVSSTRIRSAETEGTVAAVNPDPGTRLPDGATVNVFLSNGGGTADGPRDDGEWHPVRPAVSPTYREGDY